MIKKRIYLVIGRSNSRKSTIIRCLTGCRDNSKSWDMSLIEASELFYIETSSPQEKNNKVGVSPKELIDKINDLKETNILLALQSVSVSKQPNCDVYLSEMIKAGFEIKEIVSFDLSANLLGLSNQFYDTNTKSPNLIASEIRKVWAFN